MILNNLKTIEGKVISIEVEGSTQHLTNEKGDDMEGRLVLPAFVDSHAHMDSNFLLDVCKEVESEKFTEALRALIECKENLSESQIYDLAKKSIKAYAEHGSLFVRSHVMIDGVKWKERARSLLKLKEEYKGVMNLQLIGFIQSYDYFDEEMVDRAAKVIEMGFDGIGGQPHLQPSVDDGKRMIKSLFDIGTEKGVHLDFHADYADEPDSKFSEVIVSESLRRNYKKVALSHLTALHSYYDDYARRLMRWMAEAGVSVVVSPITVLEESGAHENYPKRRGIARVRDMLSFNVNVVLGHDDIQNHLNPLGVGNLMHSAFTLAIGEYMYFPKYVKSIFQMMTYNGAILQGISNYGIGEGKRASFVVLDSGDPMEALREISPVKMVVSEGKVVYENENARRLYI
ncbi:5'-deoxyadenosine deaminase [Sulfuracidifex tepidarius]|uniref:5'-deoxyadenosine deaminase n=1 Tax=Sulfuracidifex tepidarius TaxID=1294262 RepID=A0A510DYA8_9CREN|nr:amidohydrolase family protein [Sulfuracidifex tepidarius]BBG25169.1 5'-deoxyadenosine deaminase [Sulfuracidifex tepidarius]